jgi:hypothetical protein
MSRKRLIEFEYDGKKYAIVAPTQQEMLELDLSYRRAFSRAVREGLMTEFEAKRVFEKNGTWSGENEGEISRLQMLVVSLELDLENSGKEGPEGRELCFKIMQTRNELMELLNYKNRLFAAQTAEGHADTVRTAALTQMCTVGDEDKLVFPTRAAFAEHEDDGFSALCYSKAMLVAAGLTTDDIDLKIPERDWLEDRGYLKDTGAFTTKYYNEVLKLEEQIKVRKKQDSESKKKPAKRKTRKKKKKTEKVD